MKEIITDTEQLSQVAEGVKIDLSEGNERELCKTIIAELTEIMEADPEILALSAPQIGYNKQIFCLKFNDSVVAFIDPVIRKKLNGKIVVEEFASMPGKEIVIGRPTEIFVTYTNKNFDREDNKLLGKAAGLFDQQMQVLEGVTPDKYGLVSDIERDGRIVDEDMPEIVEFYTKTFIPSIQKTIDTQYNDEESKKQLKMLKFTEDVINGRIQVYDSVEELTKQAAADKIADRAILADKMQAQAQQKAAYRNHVQNVTRKKH